MAFIWNTRGNIAIWFAGMLLPLVLAMGAAVDYSVGNNARSQLQLAVDAAALAGAALRTYDSERKSDEAAALLNAHLKDIYLAAGPHTPEIAATPGKVTVSISAEVPTAFVKIVGIDTLRTNATATAVPAVQTPICLLALNQLDAESVRVGGTTDLQAEDCVVQANSSHAAALRTGGSGRASARSFCSSGGYDGTGFSPVPETDCLKVPDPFSSLPIPSITGCDFTATSLGSGAHTATPGVYCGGLEIGSGATVTLEPGIYVIHDGPLTMRAHATLAGNGVTIVLHGSDARLDILSHSNLDLTAPATGPYATVALAALATTPAGLTSLIEGGALVRVVGAFYFPTQTLDIGGASGFDGTSPYMPIVANKFVLRGNGSLVVRSDFEAAGFDDVLTKVYTGARLTH